ncbi:MAG: AmmeMemoRadiSam system protein B [Archangium sp.]
MRLRLFPLLVLSSCATVVQTTYARDTVMWDGIIAESEHVQLPDERPVVAVAPHHLIDAHEMAGFWSELARVSKPSRIVVIAPDHFYAGAPLSTASPAVSWETVYGALPSSPMTELGLPFADGLFPKEHSVHTHATFIRRFLPDVPFTAITLQWGAPRERLEALAQQLNATLPPDALVVASVDFSHYQPEPWASFHDASAFSTVSGFDLDALFLREVDSPESLFVAMRFAQLRQAKKATRWLHTNSQRRRGVFVHDSTSHQYFTFVRGEVEPKPSVSVILTGETKGLTHHEGWTWRRDVDSGAPSAPSLAALRGQEDRFFMGPEFTLFDTTEEITRTFNGMRLIIRSVELETVSSLPPLEPNSCVVTIARRGSLELNEAERRARALLPNTHVLLGRGFGAAREPEWDEHVLALSLGDWTTPNTKGNVAGITCTPDGVRLTLVPILINAAGPTLDLEALRAQLRPTAVE